MLPRCFEANVNRGPWRWSDWLGEQAIDTTLVRPGTSAEVVGELRAALAAGKGVRAIGSGHSTSSVARPPPSGVALCLHDLALAGDHTRWLKSDLSRTAPGVPAGEKLFRVRAGTTIAELNAALRTAGYALPNLGSFDGQAIAGAIATGTHGTGLRFGPLADLVVSIEMVVAELQGGQARVRHLRIEPANGVTDPARFHADPGRGDLELEQRDETFYSVVVGLGCMGVVTALTLRAVPRFWLSETCEVIRWGALKGQLQARVRDHDHFDFVMLTSRLEGEHWCLATMRTRIPWRDGPAPARDDERIHEARGKQHGDEPGISDCAVLAIDFASKKLRGMFQADAEQWPSGKNAFESRSDIVFRTTVGDHLRASSVEMAVPLERAEAAVDRVIQHLDSLPPGTYHVSPIGVRFGWASAHYLAMHHGRATCTIEAPVLYGSVPRGKVSTSGAQRLAAMRESWTSLFTKLERALLEPAYQGRPHWGQRHSVTANWARSAYPGYATWLSQYQRFNATGLFDSDFTRAMGLPRPR